MTDMEVLGDNEARKMALTRLTATAYTFTVGAVILFATVTLGFLVGALDIAVTIVFGRPDLVERLVGPRFKALLYDSIKWYKHALLFVAFGRDRYNDFEWLP